MRTGSRIVMSALTGLTVGGGGYWLAGDAFVTINLIAIYAILAWLVLGHRGAIPKGESWATNRWNGLFVVVLTLGTMPYINNQLGVTVQEGAALALLGYGVGAASFLIGIVMVRSAIADGETESDGESLGVES